MTHTEILAFTTVPLALVSGNMVGSVVGSTGTAVPDWATPILGSMGALVFAIFAVKWLITRLEKQEEKADAREIALDKKEEDRSKERDEHLRTIAEITIQNQAVISQNSQMLKETKLTIEKFDFGEIKLLAKQNASRPTK